MTEINLGRASIQPRRAIVAGQYVTLRHTYTAGHPIDDSGYLMIAFRQMGDFGTPQFDDPAAANFCKVETTGNCRIEPRWDPKGNTRPWSKALYLQVRFGYLGRGEKIIVTFGDRAGGSPGWRAQTFCEKTFEFSTLVDPYATYQFKQLPQSPEVRIGPGKPVSAVCIAPSTVVTNKAFEYYLKLQDAWGNPVARPKVLLHGGFPAPGVHTVRARDAKSKLSARSNPIDVVDHLGKLKPYWADFHGQSEETIGSNTIEDYFGFARDYALLDIAGHQGNDFQVTDKFWAKVNATTKKFYRRGRFVTFPGFEWSGNTPLGGDRNVYYKAEGGRITRSCRDLLPGGKSRYADSPTAAEMFDNLKGPGAFVFAHVGGRYADLRMHDPKVEVAVEVHSAWGTFEWLPGDAMRLGYRVGFVGNSDGHKGRPGASYPGSATFGSLGGLTCVLAKRLDRDSIHAAIKARHFFATTGNRPVLDVQLTWAGAAQAMMGDVVDLGPNKPVLHVRAIGTAPIDRIDVFNGPKLIRTLRPFAKDDLGRRIKIVWSGAEVRGRNRMVTWDGRLIVRGNRIGRMTPINFWNPDRPLRRASATKLTWQSATTGGLAGMVLDLEKPLAGTLGIDSAQRNVRCKVRSIGLSARIYQAGGLDKQIQIYRLPDRRQPAEFAFELPLGKLRRGDNPIFVRVTQIDGHLAWSSPIYVVSK